MRTVLNDMAKRNITRWFTSLAAQQTFERAPCRNLTCMAWKLASFNELKSV